MSEKVASDKHLYRTGWGPPKKKFYNDDGSATSRVFKLREKDQGNLSVDVKEMTTPEKSVGDAQKFQLFEIPVKAIEEIGLDVRHDALTIEKHGIDNPAHACIWGMEIEDDIKPGLLARRSKRIWFNPSQPSN